jgi:hypothetical protein
MLLEEEARKSGGASDCSSRDTLSDITEEKRTCGYSIKKCE